MEQNLGNRYPNRHWKLTGQQARSSALLRRIAADQAVYQPEQAHTMEASSRSPATQLDSDGTISQPQLTLTAVHRTVLDVNAWLGLSLRVLASETASRVALHSH